MRTEQLDYHLPAELIAQYPVNTRSDSRLLVLNRASGRLTDSRFSRLGDFLSDGDCLVLNDTKVLPARFFARRATGGRIEGLLVSRTAEGLWDVMMKGARRLKPGERLHLKDRRRHDFCTALVLAKLPQGKWRLKVEDADEAETVIGQIGFPPLPPYIRRNDDPGLAEVDRLRYQTVYARKAGAIAAPTAGLHFTRQLMKQLRQDGVRFAYVTLHVGTGTFMPVTSQNLEGHRIHHESFSIDSRNARIINAVKRSAGRIVAVGTTTVRTLETIASGSQVRAADGATDLFITPGYEFKIIDALVTNFHLPKSTLLALVAAFVGVDTVLAAYKHAIDQNYRFYSYGDAMLII